MHEFSVVSLGGLAAVCWVLVSVLGPVAKALAKRIEGPGFVAPPADPALDGVLEELGQLQERVDFLERAITAPRSQVELPRARTPV